MEQINCQPRFDLSFCIYINWYINFYYASLSLHVITLISYSLFLLYNYNKTKYNLYKYLNCLATKIRSGVIIYSLFMSIHHIILINNGNNITKRFFAEIFYSLYNITLFYTLILLVRYWIYLSIKLKYNNEKYEKIITYVFYVMTGIMGIYVFITDILIIFFNDKIMSNALIAQYSMWGIACLFVGGIIGIFGIKVYTYLISGSTIKSNKSNTYIAITFKAIFILYMSICIPYFTLYVLASIYLTQTYEYYLYFWLMIYGSFNFAGNITAIILFPILYRPSRNDQKLQTTQISQIV